MNNKKRLVRILLSSGLFTLLFNIAPIYTQQQIYNFQQVDSLPTFEACPTVSKLEVDSWIRCFYPKIEKMIVDSIESMSRQVGMTFDGTIKANFSIDSTGAVYEMEVKNKPHPILKKATKDVLSSIKNLKPAILGSIPVPINLTLEIEYYPNGKENMVSDDKIYKEVTTMPRFPGCEETIAIAEDRQKCANKEFLTFLYTRIEYPAEARERGIAGTAVARFVVEKDGSVSNIALLKDIGGGCGDALIFVIESMNIEGIKWIPGLLDGKLVRVEYNVPMKFRLE